MNRIVKTEWFRPVSAMLAWLVVAFATAGDAGAVTSDWVRNDQGRLRLISASDTVGASPNVRLGLQFEMAEGWKIYWRSPGEAGYPPDVDWAGSTNLKRAEILWPVPHRFTLFGMDTFGYGDQVVLPVAARAKDPGKPVNVKAKVAYLTCADICVPREATLSATLPPGETQPSKHAHLIDRYRAQVPGRGAESGLTLREVALDEGAEKTALRVALDAAPPLNDPDAVIEGATGHSFAAPTVRRDEASGRLQLRLPSSAEREDAPALRGQTVTLTVFGERRGLSRRITLGQPLDATASTGAAGTGGTGSDGGSATGWREAAGMLGLALVGGLILNLMPCVLPVLSLKLLSVVKHGGGERGHIRAGFLASAAGILVSFLVLAVGAIALKAAGYAVGWGMQFQQPAFLVAMVLIVTLFACNLLGFFEIPMPRAVADAASRAGGESSGLAGHFATGALAALLATPCSAPFLGTAVAFALSRGVVEILAIFVVLGLGLALPYLAVAAVPAVAAALPRPGRWMLRVKQALGVTLAGTGVWLLTVLAAQRGAEVALIVGGLMLAATLLIGWRGRLARVLGRYAVPGAVTGLAIAAFFIPASLGSVPNGESTDGGKWRPLDTERIDRLVDSGKVVFVDVTAEWCITCKVNKAAVIDSEKVQRLLDRDDVVRMRGDWTRRDSRIAAYLASFDRYGIPFNAVYGPAASDGIALPEMLSREGVAKAVAKAR